MSGCTAVSSGIVGQDFFGFRGVRVPGGGDALWENTAGYVPTSSDSGPCVQSGVPNGKGVMGWDTTFSSPDLATDTPMGPYGLLDEDDMSWNATLPVLNMGVNTPTNLYGFPDGGNAMPSDNMPPFSSMAIAAQIKSRGLPDGGDAMSRDTTLSIPNTVVNIPTKLSWNQRRRQYYVLA